MAKATPEGKVKKELITFLKSLDKDCYYYMPVQNGMGQTGIPDIVAVIKGQFIGFECKATPKQHPTVLQAFALDRIEKAGGVAWVVDNESIDLAIGNIKQALEYDHYAIGDNLFSTSPLFRWRDKLDVMEFGNADNC